MTSLVFGSLALLPDAAIFTFWKELLKKGTQGLAWQGGNPSSVSMTLWPSRRNGIEPDIRVEIIWPNLLRQVIVVEVKWRSGTLGTNGEQLSKQWQEYLMPDERATALHVFLGLDISEGIKAKSAHDAPWSDGQLFLRTWTDVGCAASQLTHDLLLCRWAEQVGALLNRLQITPFSGFVAAQQPQLEGTPLWVFWKNGSDQC
ncbi:hypothetical protein [Pseudomonas asuensis]|nr:hypothetical protein [Pseudomonas asuensis]